MACCCDNKPLIVVLANTATTAPATTPVSLTLDTTPPVGCCFKLCIAAGILVNSNTNPVSFTDGTTTYAGFTKCGDTLRYDSLVMAAHECCPTKSLILKARAQQIDGAFRIVLTQDVPVTSYLPVAAAT